MPVLLSSPPILCIFLSVYVCVYVFFILHAEFFPLNFVVVPLLYVCEFTRPCNFGINKLCIHIYIYAQIGAPLSRNSEKPTNPSPVEYISFLKKYYLHFRVPVDSIEIRIWMKWMLWLWELLMDFHLQQIHNCFLLLSAFVLLWSFLAG